MKNKNIEIIAWILVISRYCDEYFISKTFEGNNATIFWNMTNENKTI